MSRKTTDAPGSPPSRGGPCHGPLPDGVEDILQRLTDSFSEVSIASEFLLLRAEKEGLRPEVQLALLLQDTIVQIQKQVTELYHALGHGGRPPTLLEH